MDSDPLSRILAGYLYITSNCSQSAHNSCERVGFFFKWVIWICVRSFTETAGSLNNPETRRTTSYECFKTRCLNAPLNIYYISYGAGILKILGNDKSPCFSCQIPTRALGLETICMQNRRRDLNRKSFFLSVMVKQVDLNSESN